MDRIQYWFDNQELKISSSFGWDPYLIKETMKFVFQDAFVQYHFASIVQRKHDKSLHK